jgi:predicted outer membrane repeat protein
VVEKIQPAINKALTNSDNIDYIYIAAGTFEERIIIVISPGQEIHLIGSGPDNTIISLPSGLTGNVISADGGGKIFIEGMKIMNGTRSGIRINNSTELTIQNCEISNNIGNIGAGIYNYGSTLNINNSTISNNSATLYGGGIYNDGTLSIINSKLTDNISTSGQGGAIYNLGNLTVSNSSISNNSAASYGGIASINGIPNIINMANENWWGSELGPYNAANNPLGAGNSIADNVSFSPFLTSDPFLPVQQEDNLPPDEGNGSDDVSPPISGNENSTNTVNNSPPDNSNNILDSNYLFSQESNYFSLNHYLNFYSSPPKGFITLLYHSILGREPDIEGLDYWQQILESNSKNASDIAECLFFSEENISSIEEFDNSDFIKYLYQSILFREYDINGYDDWLSCMNAGATKQYLFNSFVASKERSDICSKFKINP